MREILRNTNATPIRCKVGKGYACCFCTEQFPEPQDLKKHTQEDHDDKAKSGYMRGVTLHNFNAKLDITDLKCNCGVDLETIDELIQHLDVEHNKPIHANIIKQIIPFKFKDGLKCAICNSEFNHFKYLMEHMSVHFRNHVCQICGAAFVNKKTFKSHCDRHETGTFPCKVCSKVFDTKVKEKEHERAIHVCMSKRNKCGYCGEMFADYVKKRDHEVRLHGAKPLVLSCQGCDKTFDNQRALTAHFKTYHLLLKRKSGEKKKCTRLSKKKNERPQSETKKKLQANAPETKKNQHNLKILLRYSNSNPIRNKDVVGYGCQFCTKQFSEPKELKEHFLHEHRLKELLPLINCRLFEYFIKLDITDLKCTLCHQSLDKLEDFMDHVTTEHNIEVYKDFKSVIVPFKFDTEKFTCVECCKEFEHFKHVLEHMTVHFSNYMCSVCGKRFVTDRLYMRHIRKHQGTRVAKKKNVRPQSDRKNKLQANAPETKKNQHNLKIILHYTNSNPIRNKDALGYGCQFCSEQFSEPKKLKEHFLQEHKIKELLALINCRLFEYFVKLDITDLKCTLCHQSLNKLEDFMDHITTEHNIEVYKEFKSVIVPFKFDTEKLTCVECCKEFVCFKHLLEHMTEHFSNYMCSVCGKGFVTDRLYMRHVRRHNAEELKCKDCDKVFGTKEKLRNHQHTVHLGNRKGSRCLICNERLLNYWQKLDHMVKVHGVPETVLTCHICDRTFKDQPKLRIHIKKDHLLERKHKCQECDMVFFSSTRLKIHMAKHTGLRQFKCDICLKAYGRKNTLREHMRIHANDRRFACEHCGQAFVQNCSLRSHKRSKHGIVA